jgi:hypothetical protein
MQYRELNSNLDDPSHLSRKLHICTCQGSMWRSMAHICCPILDLAILTSYHIGCGVIGVRWGVSMTPLAVRGATILNI